jgi:hypothetical protein
MRNRGEKKRFQFVELIFFSQATAENFEHLFLVIAL